MSKDIDKKKRVRAPNFTAEETRTLLNLALKEKNVLENKRTDSETWAVKDETWRKITELFNSSSGQTFRSVDTLRQKYDSMKKGLKKKVIRNKEETMKTGGGKPDYISIDGPERDLLEVLSATINGLPSRSDSDSVLKETTVTGERLKDVPNKVLKMEDETVVPELSQIHLICPMIEDEVGENDVEVIATELYEGNVYEKIDITKEVENNAVEKNLENNASKTLFTAAETNSSKLKWKNWSPASLKAKKHPALTPRQKKENHNKKMDGVLGLREELLQMQISNAKNEERRAQEKHEKEMELLNLNILLKKNEFPNLSP